MAARSNASAKSRRAGGNDPIQQQQQRIPQQNMQQQQQQQRQQPIKLSVSDAMALVTLRLGRVEQILQNLPVDGPMNNGSESQENIRIVDDDLFLSILNRLDDIEKKLDEPTVQSDPSIPEAVNKSLGDLTQEVKMTKDLLLQMQIFTMKLEQRISSQEQLLNETSQRIQAVQPVQPVQTNEETV